MGYSPLGVASPWWCDRTHFEVVGTKIQRRQDDLQEVLRSSSPQSNQLPQKVVWTHLKHPPQKEVEVNLCGHAGKKIFNTALYMYALFKRINQNPAVMRKKKKKKKKKPPFLKKKKKKKKKKS